MKDITIRDILQYLLYKEVLTLSRYVELLQLTDKEIAVELKKYV